MKTRLFQATFLVILCSVSSLNILAIFPYQGESHFFVFKVFLRALADRGHNLTVISHFPQKDAPKNYHDINLAGTAEPVSYESMPLERSYKSVLLTGLWIANSGKETCETLLVNKQVRDLVYNKQKFDVVLTEQFNTDCGLGIAHKLEAPVVGITSHVLMPYHYERLGIPANPSFVSFHFLEGGTRPSFVQRIERVVFNFILKMTNYWITQRSNQNELAKYFTDIPPLEDLAREIKIMLLYHNFALTGTKLFPTNVIEIGGYHVTKAKPLTGDLKKFVEEAEHGVIYVSFGSIIKSKDLPPEKVQVILDAMHELPQRFIWKWEDKSLQVADKNKLYIDSWLPQVDILGHPKTLAFFSHAGMGGTIETVTFGVPMVAMPILGDQPSNAASVEESGLGVQLQYYDLNKDNLVAALKNVLEPRFREQAKEVSAAWHDRPMSPLDTAIFWTEFVARHPKMTYRTAAADVPFCQYFLLDVVAMFLIILVVIFKLFSLICCRKTKKTETAHDGKKGQKKKSKRE